MLDARFVPTPLLAPGEKPPVAIESRSRVRFRSWSAVGEIGRLALALAGRRVLGRLTPVEAAVLVRRAVESLGGLWTKFGQLLSLRSDLYPVEFCLELAKVQDQAPGFPGAQARAIVQEALGQPIEEVFSRFDDHPVAAASIGQVHLAWLTDGTKVAVKVQRPGIMDLFERDLRLIRRLVQFMALWPALSHLSLDELFVEMERMFTEELDYRREASRMKALRRALRRHGIYVPKTWRRLNRPKVLVAEFLDGVLMSDYQRLLVADPERVETWLAENAIEPERVARRLYRSYVRQAYEERSFHADLHPGNILLLREGLIALIDFGATGQMYPEMRRPSMSILHATSLRDFDEAIDALLVLMAPSPTTDPDELKRDLLRAYRRWDANSDVDALPYRERSTMRLNELIADAARRHRVSIDWSFLRADRAFHTLNVSLMNLSPTFDLARESVKYMASALRRQARAKTRTASAAEAGDVLLAAKGAVGRVSRVMAEVEMVFRRSSLGFQGHASKMSLVGTLLLREIRLALLLATAFAGAVFVVQRGIVAFDPASTAMTFDDWFGRVPVLASWHWGLVGVAALWANRMLHQMVKRAVRKQAGDGG